MAELVIQVVDRTNAENPALDAVCWKAGDVIEVKPDGWNWTARERTNPSWRIVRVPLLTSEVQAALAVDRPEGGAMRRRRRYTLELAALPQPARFAGARQDEIVMLTRGQVVAALKLKP